MPGPIRRAKKAARAVMRGALVSTLENIPRITRHLPHAKRRREGLSIWTDVPYLDTGERAHLLDVYRLEDAPANQPALVYAHGGGFAACSKETHISLAVAFARRGFTVFNVNYRLGPKHHYPAAFDDLAAALLWVRLNAQDYEADGERVTLAGESAGANLVTSAALAMSYEVDMPWARRLHEAGPELSAVLAGCGVYQVSDMARLWRDGGSEMNRVARGLALAMEEAYLGERQERSGTHILADPVVLLEGRSPTRPLPPFFVFCGTADFLLEDSHRLKGALDRHGGVATLETYEGEPHAFHALKWRPMARRCWEDKDRFLAQLPISLIAPPG